MLSIPHSGSIRSPLTSVDGDVTVHDIGFNFWKGGPMPFIWVELGEGRTLDQRRSFARSVTEAAIEHLGAPRERVAIRFLDIKPTDFARGGVLTADAAISSDIGTESPVSS